ncbi:MAG: hypothetical protein ACYDC2_10880, partial [Solirubrobacteraceae bacterium]
GENGGSGGSKVHQDQNAENTNNTTQSAESKAKNEQKNENSSLSFLSFGSNNGGYEPCGCFGGNGGVTQSNDAGTHSSAENDNGTGQSNQQNQKGSAS